MNKKQKILELVGKIHEIVDSDDFRDYFKELFDISDCGETITLEINLEVKKPNTNTRVESYNTTINFSDTGIGDEVTIERSVMMNTDIKAKAVTEKVESKMVE